MLLLERAGSVWEERKRSSPARSLWLIGRSEVGLWRGIISGLLLLSCSLFSHPLVCLLKASLVNKLLCFTYICSFLSSLFVTKESERPWGSQLQQHVPWMERICVVSATCSRVAHSTRRGITVGGCLQACPAVQELEITTPRREAQEANLSACSSWEKEIGQRGSPTSLKEEWSSFTVCLSQGVESNTCVL